MDEQLTQQHPQLERELIDRITKLQHACSDERIRAIFREEIAAWEKQQVATRRVQVGWRPNLEAK